MNSLPLVLVVAVAENGVIGRDQQLPWRIPGDMKHFKAVTMGKPMVMGRKNYDSIGRPLPGRTSIVLTRNTNWRAEGVLVAHSLDEALKLANEDARKTGAKEIAVIGGTALFEETLPIAAKIELTEVHAKPEGDVYFPKYDRSAFRETRREGPMQSEKDDHAFSVVTLERKP
ncbi:MAG: dihydrofolate reductase [Xanthobacteraceae bacterium]|nr:dihydrofolate reductase [Xanthobacteraceae bacterium]MBX3550695.1 dihydrofolate reductase [Xanthobacteraceae bacterium]MCW5676490.1 dihydrofolate reductase [Xanthobacteraceae bacterium]